MAKRKTLSFETVRTDLALAIAALSVVYYGSADPWFEFALFSSIFLLTAAAFWRGEIVQQLNELRFFTVPCLLLAALSLLQTLGYFFANAGVVPEAAFVPISFDAASSFRSAVKILALLSLILLILEVLRTNFQRFVTGLALIGTGFAVFAIVRYLLQEIYFEGIGFLLLPRLLPGAGFGTFLNQNHFALSMLMILALNLNLFWFGQHSAKLRSIFAGGAVVSWIAIILTASRGGIVSSIAVWILFFSLAAFSFVRNSDYKHSQGIAALAKIAVFVLVVAGSLIAGIALIGQERVVQRFSDVAVEFKEVEHQQAFRRIEAWDAALDLIAERPVFGVGLGGYKYAASRHLEISGRTFPSQAHNDILEIVVSVGLIGSLLSIWIFVMIALAIRTKLQMPLQTFGGAAFAGALCGVAGVAIHSLFDYGLQFTGNSFIFAALVSIIMYRYPSSEKISDAKSLAHFSVVILTVLALISAAGALTGFARKAAKHEILSIDPPKWIFLFDPDFTDARAEFLSSSGDLDKSAEMRSISVENQPKDFLRRLRLAETLSELSKNQAAEQQFKEAIALAPFYGEPRFHYGTFLLKIGKREEAIAQLADAFHKDFSKAKRALDLIWDASGRNTSKMLGALEPAEAEIPEVHRFFMKRGETAAIVQLSCLPSFPDYQRSISVHQLLEKSEFQAAWKIHSRNCESAEPANPGVPDGGFEAGKLTRDLGFGWRIGNSIKLSQLGFDEDERSEGIQSLRIDLNGKIDPNILSTFVPVRPDGSYELSFDYKIDDEISGTPVFLQILLRKPGLEILESEIRLSNGDSQWHSRRADLKTFEKIEAIEIRLIVKDCGKKVCTGSGTIWLDNFKLIQK